HRTPGPIKDPTYKIHPGLDFSYVAPVSKRFGFTLSGGYSSQYTMQDFMTNTWRGAGNATSAPAANGTPGALPDTTPDKPYLTNYSVRDGTKLTSRASLGATTDFKLTRNDMISFGVQYAYFDASFNNRSLGFAISRVLPGNFDTRTTNGDVGQATITVTDGTTRAPVDPYNLSSYVLNAANSDFREGSDVQRTARANLGRDFRIRDVPIAFKTGVEIRESMRDIRGGTSTYTFNGRDGV